MCLEKDEYDWGWWVYCRGRIRLWEDWFITRCCCICNFCQWAFFGAQDLASNAYMQSFSNTPFIDYRFSKIIYTSTCQLFHLHSSIVNKSIQIISFDLILIGIKILILIKETKVSLLVDILEEPIADIIANNPFLNILLELMFVPGLLK